MSKFYDNVSRAAGGDTDALINGAWQYLIRMDRGLTDCNLAHKHNDIELLYRTVIWLYNEVVPKTYKSNKKDGTFEETKHTIILKKDYDEVNAAYKRNIMMKTYSKFNNTPFKDSNELYKALNKMEVHIRLIIDAYGMLMPSKDGRIAMAKGD